MNLLNHSSLSTHGCWGVLRHGLVVCLLAGLAAPSAMAVRPAHDAKIDELEGYLSREDKSWELEIEFEVEIETDRMPAEEFALVLNISNDGRPIKDDRGKPFEIAVPLEKPSKVKDDEIEFKGEITIILERRDIDDPRRVRVVAQLVRVEDDLTHDVERAKVKYDKDDDHGAVVVIAPYVNVYVRW